MDGIKIEEHIGSNGNFSDSTALKQYAFCQQMIWEELGYDCGTFIDGDIQAEYVNFKNEVNNKKNKMIQRPSFDDTTINLKIGETKQVTDANGVLSEYETIDVTENNIRIQHNKGENFMTFTVNENCTIESYKISDDMFKSWGMIKNGTENKNTTIYIEFASDVQDQLYSLNYNDPVTLKVSLAIEALGKLIIKKQGENGELINGARFLVTGPNSYSQEVTVNGTGTLDELKPGTYHIKEIQAPKGYVLDTTAYDVEVQTGQTTEKVISNKEQTGEIKFKKVNENGDALASVEFELYADEDIKDPTGSITYYTKDQKIRSIITGTDGVGRIGNLRLGKYYLKEFAPLNGYLADEQKHKFSIDSTDAEAETIFVDLGELINYEPKGKITVTKTNKNGDKVPNAKFTVTAAEDIINKAGTVTYYHAGDEVGTIENTSSGTGTLENLHLGKYIVTENYAPTGYLLNTESKEVELKYADENTSVVFDSTTIINDEPTGVIDVKKADVLTGNDVRVDGTYHHGDATFSGAVYTLYAGEKITNYAKTVDYYNKDDEIAKFTFDATGTPTVKILKNADGVSLTISGSKLKGLPMGSYYLRETELPKSGYLPDTTTYNFSVDYVDQYTKDIDVSQTVKEQVERAKFELIKVSTDMNQVAPVVDKAQFTAILEKYVKYYGGFDAAYEHRNEFAEDEWCTFETDLDGHGISDFLAYGKYVVSETYVPDSDINRVEEFTVTIDENSDGVIKEVIANDSPFTAYIKMVKKDKKTGKTVTYSNATFELYKYDRATREWNLVQCKVGSKYYREWTTDENGVCETETTLDSGTYRLVEKVIPKGFNELEDNLIFYVNSMNESVEYDLNWDAWITVEVENEQPTGKLVVDKSVLLKEDVDKSLIDTSDLSSIKFRLKANEDIIDYADGSVIYKKGETIGEYNVDADGHLEIAELPMGKYTLQEISFLDGTVLNSEVYEVNFEQTDTKTKEYVVEKDIENQTTLFEISKSDITGENEVVGAKLQIIDENGNVIDEWISKKQPHSIEGLTVDKEYTLREEISAEGFVKATDIKFTVENTADMQKVQMKDEQVIAKKLDSDGENVIGAKLQVVDENGEIVDSWTTDGNIHYISNLEEGKTYTLQEVKVPDPYVKADDIEFTVPSNKTNIEIEMIDKKVAILKTDVNGNAIEGAVLYVTDEEGNILDEWTSTLEEHYIKGLEKNKTYKIYEKVAPDKYVQIDERKFTVNSDKTTQIEKVVDEQVLVNKIDIDGNSLQGAKLQIIDKEGSVIDEWITDGTQHIVSGLKENETYILHEETAPEGYVKVADKEFTVPSNSKNLEIEIIDKIVTMTKTDIGGNEVEDAKMTVTDENGEIVDSWTSTKEPHHITGLEEGKTYTLHEEVAPNGYVKATDVEFTVTTDKETQAVEMIDKVIDITKTDLTNGGELEGAELVVTDEKGNIIDKWVSSKEPHHVSGLEEGKKYTLTEITAPYGYEIAESIEFEVSFDKETQIIEMKDMPILKSVRVEKLDKDTKEHIKSNKFVFGIYEDEACTKLIKEAGANEYEGTALFEELRYGTYYIKEIKAPTGYKLSEQVVKIEINELGVFADGVSLEEKDDIYSFEYFNSLLPKIQTGNETNYILLGSLALISLTGIVIVIAVIKQKDDEE